MLIFLILLVLNALFAVFNLVFGFTGHPVNLVIGFGNAALATALAVALMRWND